MAKINGKKIYTAGYVKRVRTEERTKYAMKIDNIIGQLYEYLDSGNNELNIAIELLEDELRNSYSTKRSKTYAHQFSNNPT